MSTFETALSSYLKSAEHCPTIRGAEPPERPHPAAASPSFSAGSGAQALTLSSRRSDVANLNVPLTLATYHKAQPHHRRKRMGSSTLVLGQEELTLLRKLSSRLERLNQSRIAVHLEPGAIQLRTPILCGELQDCAIELTRGEERHHARMSVIGRHRLDGGVIYTDSVSVQSLLK